MNKQEAKTLVKSINRHVKKRGYFKGQRSEYGVDYATWMVCYPKMGLAYQKACEIIAGRTGMFMPNF